jgi:hypothetical protein
MRSVATFAVVIEYEDELAAFDFLTVVNTILDKAAKAVVDEMPGTVKLISEMEAGQMIEVPDTELMERDDV